jgi:hypothetical protein
VVGRPEFLLGLPDLRIEPALLDQEIRTDQARVARVNRETLVGGTVFVGGAERQDLPHGEPADAHEIQKPVRLVTENTPLGPSGKEVGCSRTPARRRRSGDVGKLSHSWVGEPNEPSGGKNAEDRPPRCASWRSGVATRLLPPLAAETERGNIGHCGYCDPEREPVDCSLKDRPGQRISGRSGPLAPASPALPVQRPRARHRSARRPSCGRSRSRCPTV